MSGRWCADTRTWTGWEFLGPAPDVWPGPMGALAPEPGLHAYQRRNIPLVELGGQRVLGGPRPPYFSWHGRGDAAGQPEFAVGTNAHPGVGIHLMTGHAQAKALAGAEGHVLAFYYCNAPRLVLFDGRAERHYEARQSSRLAGRALFGHQRGSEILADLVALLGPGEGITQHLRGLGFNGLVTGSTAAGQGLWCIFDPRVFKYLLPAKAWDAAEIARREAFDPVPI